MNARVHKARIQWLSADVGGRPAPPTGPRYSTVARFAAVADKWPTEAWSVVLEIEEPANTGGVMTALIRLLAPDAPDLLVQGGEFDLFEGRTIVARGVVL